MIKDFKEGSDVVFEVTAEYVINISNILNSRTTNVVKFAEIIHNVIDITRFSSLKKLAIVTIYVTRFANNLKGKGTPSWIGLAALAWMLFTAEKTDVSLAKSLQFEKRSLGKSFM